MILRDGIFRAAACLAILMLAVPFVSASVGSTSIPGSSGPGQADQPDAIASLKLHTAYVCEDQDLSMLGTIHYIDTISKGAGITGLQQIRDDYLVIASSIPMMRTSDDITRARDELREQTQQFAEETAARMVQFNGSRAAMKTSSRAYINTTRTILSGNESTHWLANESARLTLFNRASVERLLLLRELGRQGINTNTTQLVNLSAGIDAERPDLRNALSNKSTEALESANEAIRILTHQFRDRVAAVRAAHEIELKRDAMMAKK
jgi:hypothetical protein